MPFTAHFKTVRDAEAGGKLEAEAGAVFIINGIDTPPGIAMLQHYRIIAHGIANR